MQNNNSSNPVTVSFNKDTQLHELTINGMLMLSPEKGVFHIPETLLRGLHISSLPRNISVIPYSYVYVGGVVHPKCVIEISNKGNKEAKVEIQACHAAESFMDMIGVRPFQQLKKELILEQVQLSPKISLNYQTEDTVHLHYNVIFPEDEIQNLIEKACTFDKNLSKKILGSVPDTLQLTKEALKRTDHPEGKE